MGLRRRRSQHAHIGDVAVTHVYDSARCSTLAPTRHWFVGLSL